MRFPPHNHQSLPPLKSHLGRHTRNRMRESSPARYAMTLGCSITVSYIKFHHMKVMLLTSTRTVFVFRYSELDTLFLLCTLDMGKAYSSWSASEWLWFVTDFSPL